MYKQSQYAKTFHTRREQLLNCPTMRAFRFKSSWVRMRFLGSNRGLTDRYSRASTSHRTTNITSIRSMFINVQEH